MTSTTVLHAQRVLDAAVFVPAHNADGADQIGWAYGIASVSRNQRSGKKVTWLIIPGSNYGARLFDSEQNARTAVEYAFPAYDDRPAGSPFDVHKVKTAFRFGRIWFKVIDPSATD